MAIITYLQDTFNRANGAPGSTEVGKAPWRVDSVNGVGSWSISSNQIAAASNGSESYITADGFHSDGVVEAKMVNIVDGGVIFRYWDSANLWMVWATGGVYKLMKKNNNAWTQVGPNFGAPKAGDVISVSADYRDLNVYINGTWMYGVTDDWLSWATRAGFRASASAATYDDFSQKSLNKSGIGPNDPNIYYSPYTWSVDANGAKTICSGAYFKTIIQGNRGQIGLFFNTIGLTTTNIIKYRIDGEGWVKANVAEQISIPMPTASSWSKHTLEVIVQTAMAPNKWNPQDSATIFRGIAGEDTLTALPPEIAQLKGVVFGDSITEGYITLKNVATPDGSDAQVAYAGALRNYIGAEIGQVGFGSTGWSVAGAGGVPAFPSNYKLLWGGGPARVLNNPVPDFVLINHGTNDGSTDITATVVATLREILTLVPPTTMIGVIVPFNQNQKANLTSAVATVNSPQVKLIDTTGWYSVSDSADGIHPYGGTSMNILAPKLAAAVRNLLNGGSLYMNVGGVAKAVMTRKF